MKWSSITDDTQWSDHEAEMKEWRSEWGALTPLTRGGLAVGSVQPRPTSATAVTRCDLPSALAREVGRSDPEINVVVELDLDDIADACD